MVIDISLLGNLSGVASIGLGIFVYFSNPRRKLNRSLALFSFLLGIWVFALYFYSHPLWLSSESWIKITYLIVILYLPILAYFIYHFPEKDRYSKWFVPHFIVYVVTNIPLAAILLFTKLWIVDVLPGPKGLETILGPAYVWWGIVTIFNLVYLYPLFIRFKNSTGIRKQQIYFFAIGVALFAFGAIFFDLLLPLAFKNTSFFWFSSVLSLAMVIFTSYAIMRYRLMDIRWVLGRTAIYLFSFSTVALYSFVFIYLNEGMKNIFPNVIWGVTLGITSSLVFFYSLNVFEKLAARYFYYTLYNLKDTLNRLTKEINKATGLESIVNLINRFLLDALKLEKIGIVAENRETNSLEQAVLINFRKDELSEILRRENGFLARYLHVSQKPLIREEIPFIINEANSKDKKKMKGALVFSSDDEKGLTAIKEEMEKQGIGAFLPLLIDQRLIGIIILGDKISARSYSVQEIDLLTALSSQASLALNNALAYHELEKRKEELERFYKLTVGRELTMVSLKEEVKRLKKEKDNHSDRS